jgi:hypothetical protein
MSKLSNRTIALATLLRQKLCNVPFCIEAADELQRLHRVEVQFKELRARKLSARTLIALVCISAFAGSFAASWTKQLTRRASTHAAPSAPQEIQAVDEKS